jgi:hypothetical protein
MSDPTPVRRNDELPDWLPPEVNQGPGLIPVAGGLIDDMARAARERGVMVSLTVTPYTEEASDE